MIDVREDPRGKERNARLKGDDYWNSDRGRRWKSPEARDKTRRK
jgi:hypothetical protein